MAFIIYGKLDNNFFRKGSFTKSYEGDSSCHSQSQQVQSKKMVAVAESDESDDLERMIVNGKDMCKKQGDNAVEGCFSTTVINGEKGVISTCGDVGKNMG